MQMECSAVVKFCLWELLLERKHFTRHVVLCVSSSEQDKRNYGYPLFTSLDARSHCLVDRRARKLQESVGDSPPACACSDQLYQLFELAYTFGISTTVPRDDNTVFFYGRWSHGSRSFQLRKLSAV